MVNADKFATAVQIMDDIHPNWWQKIDPEKLNMLSSDDCILGQLYGCYTKGYDLVRAHKLYGQYAGIGYGSCFACNESRDLWRDLIRTRRALAATEDVSFTFADQQALDALLDKKRRHLSIVADESRMLESLCACDSSKRMREGIINNAAAIYRIIKPHLSK